MYKRQGLGLGQVQKIDQGHDPAKYNEINKDFKRTLVLDMCISHFFADDVMNSLQTISKIYLIHCIVFFCLLGIYMYLRIMEL